MTREEATQLVLETVRGYLTHRTQSVAPDAARDIISVLETGGVSFDVSARNKRYIPDIVKNAMLTAWNEICSDTECHPTDIKRNHDGKRGHLGFEPEHWARLTGEIVKTQLERLKQ